MKYAIETVAVLPQGAQGYRHVFMAAASKEAADWHVEREEKSRGFDAWTREVTEEEWEAILRGEWNGWLGSSKLPPR